MAVALSRVRPAVVQRLQVPVGYCFTRDCLFRGISPVDKHAFTRQPGGDGAVADADPLSRVAPGWVRAGARWLLAEMLLFFVPAVVAVVNCSC